MPLHIQLHSSFRIHRIYSLYRMHGILLFLKLEKEEETGYKVIRASLSVPTGLLATTYFHRICAFRTVTVSQDLGLDLILCLLSSSNLLLNIYLGDL